MKKIEIDELLQRIENKDKEIKKLKDLLLAAFPAIRHAFKQDVNFYPYEDTEEMYVNQNYLSGTWQIENWKVWEESKRILGLE